MFPPLKTEIDARFATVESFFRVTKPFEQDEPLVALAAKGLIFVQLYAIYEFTVKSVVQRAIDAINAHSTRINTMSPSLMALYLDPELSAVRMCGGDKLWEKRLQLFQRAFSSDVVTLPNTAGPPHDGSHYRHTQLVMILDVFGIKRLPVRRKRHLYRIDEVVGHRNQIAHGSETAEDVGRRYTRPEIVQIIEQMKSVCLSLVDLFENYCADSSKHRRR